MINQTKPRFMFKKFFLLSLAAGVAFQACSQKNAGSGKLTTLPSGLQYQFVTKAKGKKNRTPVEGDLVKLHITFKTEGDSIIQTSRSMPEPPQFPYQKGQFNGSWEEGLSLMSAGDSAIFYMNTDSIFVGPMAAQRPPFLPEGSKVKVGVNLFEITSLKEMKENQAADLKKYAKDKKLGDVKTTESGLMYVITSEGTGSRPAAGAEIEVHYTGTLLNGTKFDSSVDRGEPFKFQVGQGMVIKGWDEGLQLLKEGSKAVLLIPSDLAYGDMGSPPTIPAAAPLVFEVELIKVNGASAPETK